MSDRIDFWEIRQGNEDDWDSVCLVKEEEDAKQLAHHLLSFYSKPLFIWHVEIVAETNLNLREW